MLQNINEIKGLGVILAMPCLVSSGEWQIFKSMYLETAMHFSEIFGKEKVGPFLCVSHHPRNR